MGGELNYLAAVWGRKKLIIKNEGSGREWLQMARKLQTFKHFEEPRTDLWRTRREKSADLDGLSKGPQKWGPMTLKFPNMKPQIPKKIINYPQSKSRIKVMK